MINKTQNKKVKIFQYFSRIDFSWYDVTENEYNEVDKEDRRIIFR